MEKKTGTGKELNLLSIDLIKAYNKLVAILWETLEKTYVNATI